ADCVVEDQTLNNTSSVTTSVTGSAIDLAVGDITDTPDPVAEGDLVTYTTTVTNGGSQDAKASEGHQVVVRVVLPTVGVILQAPLASQGFVCTTSNANAVVTCVGDLLAGQSTLLTLKLQIQANAPAQLTVKVTADPLDAILETNEANNAATEVTSVTHVACTTCIDLLLGQVLATNNPTVNDRDVTYQFVVTNVGDQSTASDPAPHDVVIAVDLDRGANELSLVSVAATAGVVCGANPAFPLLSTAPEILCTVPATGFAPGGGTEVTVVAHAKTAALPSFVDFDVSVDPANQISEFSEVNNVGGLRVTTVAP
ncbi:MAG: CARDB domain-containing protein, partial [Lapillicoccus sp.]